MPPVAGSSGPSAIDILAGVEAPMGVAAARAGQGGGTIPIPAPMIGLAPGAHTSERVADLAHEADADEVDRAGPGDSSC